MNRSVARGRWSLCPFHWCFQQNIHRCSMHIFFPFQQSNVRELFFYAWQSWLCSQNFLNIQKCGKKGVSTDFLAMSLLRKGTGEFSGFTLIIIITQGVSLSLRRNPSLHALHNFLSFAVWLQLRTAAEGKVGVKVSPAQISLNHPPKKPPLKCMFWELPVCI